MLSVLPLRSITKVLGFTYIAVVIGSAFLLKPDISTWSLSHIWSVGSTVLGGFLLGVPLIASVGWRFLWRRVPYLQSIYPDISGEWDVAIQWNRNGNQGTVLAKATVRQDLLRISMELEAPDSDSRTLSAVPKKDPESGRAILHYMYLVKPHATSGNTWGAYHGAAILDFSAVDVSRLAGNYWTSHLSSGRLTMTRPE